MPLGRRVGKATFHQKGSTRASNFPLLLLLPLTLEASLPSTLQDPGLPTSDRRKASWSHPPSPICPPFLGAQPDEQGAGQGGSRASFLPELLSAGARSPTVPWGQIHHATRSGLLSGRVKWPAAAGRWEPITAIFNLIKAVSTIDFGSFNY